jgi:Tol biopolymer transport system component
MNADGSDQHQLGSLTGLDPDWSPDGQRLVFDRGFGPGEGISVAAADGTGAQPLTSGWDDDPHWSPDGRTIAFVSARNDIVQDDNFPRFELYLVGADGSNLHPLTYRVPAAWATPGEVRSAAGRLIASFEAPGATGGVALTGTRVAVLTRDLEGGGHLTLFSAPSGKLLATVAVPGAKPVMAGANARWVVYTTGTRTIRAVDLRTLRTTTLAVARRAPLGLSVSGRRVAWAENVAGGGRVVALSLAP